MPDPPRSATVPIVSAPLPYSIPTMFAAGETVKYRRAVPEYPAGEGWTLKLYLAGPSAAVEVVAVAVGNEYDVTVTATVTAPLIAGSYEYRERVFKGAEVISVDSGRVQITPNIATATAGALQSWAEKALAAIEAELLIRAGKPTSRYSIGDRAYESFPLEQLMKMRDQLKSELRHVASGGAFSRPVLVAFTGNGL
ncbi:MAG: hypothetical protein A2V88_02600 [Elusimicrobia bacterium RBG_16_66_12]|nr:MAG: hypothetical protein A2V88_02600 [Elusimicrobia bacterium RBG_16_66_12]